MNLPKPILARDNGIADAAASVDKVIETFWTDFATEDSGRYWWWARDVWTDPNAIIADDDEGGLWRVEFTSDGDQAVTFGDPTKVLQQFVDAPAAAMAAARSIEKGRQIAHYRTRAEAGREGSPDKGSAIPGRTFGMDEATLTRFRKQLDLAADATEADVNAELQKRALASADEGGGDPDPDPAGDDEGDPDPDEDDDADPDPDPAPDASTQLPPGMVAVPADTWARVQDGAEAGATLAVESETARRDDTIEAAVKAGKIPPSDRDSMVNLHTANRDSFYALLTKPVADGGLKPGLVPVVEAGTARPGELGSEAELSAVMASFGPQYADRKVLA